MGFFIASIAFFISIYSKNYSSELHLLILAASGIIVLTLWTITILKYLKREASVLMKANEMIHKESITKKEDKQYIDGQTQRNHETEFNNAKDILKLLIELKKRAAANESTNPTTEDIKKLKEYLQNHKDLINQITEIVKTK